MRFVKTISFSTSGSFNSEKDDREVNRVLQAVQSAGVGFVEMKVLLAGRETGATSLYVIEYEADAPLP